MRLHIVARQPLGKNVTAAMNTHAIIENLLDALLSIRSVSYQRKVGCLFFPELLVFFENEENKWKKKRFQSKAQKAKAHVVDLER
jgi:hypothetical protein